MVLENIENILLQCRKLVTEARELLDCLNNPDDGMDIAAISQKYQLIQARVVVAERVVQYATELDELGSIIDMPGVEEECIKVRSALEAAAHEFYDRFCQESVEQSLVTMEIKPGVGGDEAALFAGDLFGMYCRYADFKGWKYQVVRLQIEDSGGVKEAVIDFDSHEATPSLQLEAGVHRVQRVPATEAMGRIHTSTAVVCVLPRIQRCEIEIDKKDLEIQYCRASGPGGQSVNKSDSAVNILHIPTGIRVSQQDERSQKQNQDKAIAVLKERLMLRQQKELADKLNKERTSQSAGGDRADKMRTYHFPQNRITDHRYQVSVYALEEMLGGGQKLDAFFKQLAEKSRSLNR
jgi:peptide chain release factor 1